MTEISIREEYEKALLENRDKILNLESFTGKEKRAHPRVWVSTEDLWISTIPEFSLVDLSASGISIRSNHPLKPGEMIHVSLGESFSVDTEVVNCVMEIPPDEYIDGQFRIQCRFLEDLPGMELFVRMIRSN